MVSIIFPVRTWGAFTIHVRTFNVFSIVGAQSDILHAGKLYQ